METPDTFIRRAPRTYGRRRDPGASDVDPALHAESSASSHNSSPAFSESGRDVPPSSDFETSFTNADDDVEDAPDDDGGSPGNEFTFGWRLKMKEIDMQYDDDMEGAPPPLTVPTDDAEGSAERPSRPTRDLSAGVDDPVHDEEPPIPKLRYTRSAGEDLAQIDLEYNEASGTHSHKGAVLPLSAENPDDPFGPPLLLPASNPQPITTDPKSSRQSPSPSFQTRRVSKRRTVAHASDSESENAGRSSPLTSPGALHPINTPRHSSSPTPPTTQEMNKGKGKGKARSETPAEEESVELPALDAKAPSKTKGKRKEKEKRVKV